MYTVQQSLENFSPCNTDTQFQILFNKHQGRDKLSQLPERKRCMQLSLCHSTCQGRQEGTHRGHDPIYLTPKRLCKQEADSMRKLGGHAPWRHNDYGVDRT